MNKDEAQPEQEPVAWHHPECEGQCIACLIEQVVQEAYGNQGLGYLQRHLTSTQPKPWVGLTDEDKEELDEKYGDDTLAHLDAIEAKLKEKNCG